MVDSSQAMHINLSFKKIKFIQRISCGPVADPYTIEKSKRQLNLSSFFKEGKIIALYNHIGHGGQCES